MTLNQRIVGSWLGDFTHERCQRPASVAQLQWLLLIAEDHSFTFKTCEQPYRRELDGVPFGPMTMKANP